MNRVHKLLAQPKPIVMGVLNITPDSFSDGGKLLVGGLPDKSRVLAQAKAMVMQGADIFDVGGESTRPGASPISTEQECDRVLPVVEWLVEEFDIPVSVDTSTPKLMQLAANLGASMLNDVRSFNRDNALEEAVQTQLPICIMHMQGQPSTMQDQPSYGNTVAEVTDFLTQRIKACLAAGIKKNNIVVDPGFGFGKTLQHNLDLFRQLPNLVALGYPVLVGVSRKTMIGEILKLPVEQRVHGSVAAAMLAVQRGAKIVRVHDIGATVQALRIMQAIEARD